MTTSRSKKAPARREFRMHKRLLWDVITKQAGTIEKSLLEAVMNSIDAGATKVNIEFKPKRFVIADNGKGFGSEKEIEDFFETFGFTHEENDAIYGRYRMGRGQLFCFGRNIWKSQQYCMTVDLKPQEASFKASDDLGLGYELSELAPPQPGCSVEVQLYEPLLPRAYNSALHEIGQFVKYAEIPIFLNGKQINVIPSDAKWTHETPEAYFNLRSGSSTLKIYNLGVFVRDHFAGKFGGIGGEIVSKSRLDVNFARNDIVSTCPIWRSIQKTLREEGGVERTRKTKLSDADRESMAAEIMAGDMNWQEILDARVLTDVTGGHKTLASLASTSGPDKIVAVTTGDRRGERALTAKVAYVLSTDTLDRFNAATTVDFCSKIRKALEAESEDVRGYHEFPTLPGKYHPYIATRLYNALGDFEHIKSSDLAKYFSDNHETVPEKELTKTERIARSALQDASHSMRCSLKHINASDETWGDISSSFGSQTRKIMIGQSDTAQAWTDGNETIWVERHMLNLLKHGESGWIRLAGLLLHEYAHNNDDRNSHIHDAEFYETIERALIENDCIGHALASIRQALYKAARDAKKLGNSFLCVADKNETIAKSGLSTADSSFANSDTIN